jgi:hypothetical protein
MILLNSMNVTLMMLLGKQGVVEVHIIMKEMFLHQNMITIWIVTVSH